MFTINGIEITDYSSTSNADEDVITFTTAVKHNAALAALDINDVVTVAGNISGSFTYTAIDSHNQKCFELV